MKNQIKAVRQDSQDLKNLQMKFTQNDSISKIYEIEFLENFKMTWVKVKIREKGKCSKKDFLSLKKTLKITEYREIFVKLLKILDIEFVSVGVNDWIEKLLERLSKPFIKFDSIADFTIIEYDNGRTELRSQPEL